MIAEGDGACRISTHTEQWKIYLAGQHCFYSRVVLLDYIAGNNEIQKKMEPGKKSSN